CPSPSPVASCQSPLAHAVARRLAGSNTEIHGSAGQMPMLIRTPAHFAGVLDEKDRLILRELREDSKKTTKTIAESTGIPRTTVHDRIHKMEQSGVIRRFTVVPNYEQIGEPTTAFVFISYSGGTGSSQKEVAEQLAKLEGVYEVHMIS